jgi:ABC-type sugar transport system substrate-binding protein
VQGLIVSHGQPESLKDVVQKAVDAGIKIVAKDVDLGNPKVPLISQNDHEIARQVLNQALKDNGRNFQAGYVFVAGFRPLELRGEVWALGATSATNPAVVGEVSLPAVALMIAGQDPGKVIEVSPILITQEQLNKNNIKTIADLDSKLPGFGHSDQATASWIASVGK